MKALNTALGILTLLFMLKPVYAVPPGIEVIFSKSPMGKVTFKGGSHMAKGLKCDACHPKLFQQKKGMAKIRLEDHQKSDKFCFACHNGKAAFSSEHNCAKCHAN